MRACSGEDGSSTATVGGGRGKWRLPLTAPPSDLKETAGGISREHVLWSYRLFLDREASPQDDVDAKLGIFSTARELRAAFLNSPEYAHSNPGGVGFVPTTGTVITELPGNLRLFLDLADRVIGMNILRGNYELEEVEFVRSCVASGDHVLDVGANIGYFTILMASWVGEAGTVLAFEPVPANLDLLRRSIAENRFEDRVRVIPNAVADAPGEADILSVDVRYAFNSGGAFIVKEEASTPLDHRRIRVAKTQLDTLEMARPVSFIKLDVEGAEGLALRGARDLLRADRPTVACRDQPAATAESLRHERRGSDPRNVRVGIRLPPSRSGAAGQAHPVDRVPGQRRLFASARLARSSSAAKLRRKARDQPPVIVPACPSTQCASWSRQRSSFRSYSRAHWSRATSWTCRFKTNGRSSGTSTKWTAGTWGVQDLVRSHNGHRIAVPRLIMVGLALASDWRADYPAYLGIVFAAGILALAWSALPPSTDAVATVAAAAFIGGLVASPNQWENWLWGIQMHVFLVVLLAMAALALLSAGPLRPGRVGAAAVLALVATLTQGAGLVLWPVGALVLAARGVAREVARRARPGGAWAFAGVLVVLAYLARQPGDAGAGVPSSWVFHHPVAGLRFVLALLGHSLVAWNGAAYPPRDGGLAASSRLLPS